MSRHTIPLGTGRSESFEIPDHTEVTAVAELGPRLAAGSAAAKAAERRLAAARANRNAFDDDSKREVRAAARAGASSPSKKLVKRLRTLDEELVEAELEYEGAVAVMLDLRAETLATLRKHAPALRAEAVAQLDADVLKLATLHAKLREVQAAFVEHSGTLGLIERLRTGGKPVMKHPSPGVKATIAVNHGVSALGEAIAHATTLMEQGKVAPLPTTGRDDADEPDEPDEADTAEALDDLDESDLADDGDDDDE